MKKIQVILAMGLSFLLFSIAAIMAIAGVYGWGWFFVGGVVLTAVALGD